MFEQGILGEEHLTTFQHAVLRQLRKVLASCDPGQFDLEQTDLSISQAINPWLDLSLRPANPTAFTTALCITPNSALITLGPWQDELLPGKGPDAADTFAVMLGALLADVLAGRVKIVEHRSNDRPYRWVRHDLVGESWQERGHTGLLLYPFFGIRTSVELFGGV